MSDPFESLYARFGAGACSLAMAELGYESQPTDEPGRSGAAARVLVVLEYLDAQSYIDLLEYLEAQSYVDPDEVV
jgi:hypothetical protein